jgi:hypothetical protein
MGLGVQLDEDWAEAGYYYDDIFADPPDNEAPPVWGYSRGSCWSRLSVDNRILLIGTIAFFLVMGLLTGSVHYHPSASRATRASTRAAPAAWSRRRSASSGSRMNRTCVDRADVVVAYSGVPLGWARAETLDCAEKRWAKDVEVVARGDGVGLSSGLRDRMASEWQSGTLELDVDVRIFGAAGNFPHVMMTCKVRMDGRGSESDDSESLPFSWYSLNLFTYDYVG